jgi:hypothetical protein
MTSSVIVLGVFVLLVAPASHLFASLSTLLHPALVLQKKNIQEAVLRIRIHRILMFLGLLDPDPDPSVRCMDPDSAPDLNPSVTKQKK